MSELDGLLLKWVQLDVESIVIEAAVQGGEDDLIKRLCRSLGHLWFSFELRVLSDLWPIVLIPLAFISVEFPLIVESLAFWVGWTFFLFKESLVLEVPVEVFELYLVCLVAIKALAEVLLLILRVLVAVRMVIGLLIRSLPVLSLVGSVVRILVDSRLWVSSRAPRSLLMVLWVPSMPRFEVPDPVALSAVIISVGNSWLHESLHPPSLKPQNRPSTLGLSVDSIRLLGVVIPALVPPMSSVARLEVLEVLLVLEAVVRRVTREVALAPLRSGPFGGGALLFELLGSFGLRAVFGRLEPLAGD